MRGIGMSNRPELLEDEDENKMSWDMVRAGPGSARDMVQQTKEQRKFPMLREIDPLFREPRPTKRKRAVALPITNHQSPITFLLPPPSPRK